MFFQFLLSFYCVFLVSNTAVAGWAVGGGELVLDSGNPWFVRNTSVVTYCVKTDETHFGLSDSRTQELVENALSFWKLQLETKSFWKNWGVGQQIFLRVGCSKISEADITFLFGTLDELSPLERKQFKNPSRHIGISVRTQYNPWTMKGRGFIYLSPQSGPLALEKSSGKMDSPWNYAEGALANFVLIHELGHVFGYKHGDNVFSMDERFADNLLDPLYAPVYASMYQKLIKIKSFAFSGNSQEECIEASQLTNQPGHKQMREFFGIPETDLCLRYETDREALKVFSRKNSEPESKWTLVGKGHVEVRTVREQAGPTIYLPPEQRQLHKERQVFGDVPNLRYLALPGAQVETATARYKAIHMPITRDLIFVSAPNLLIVSGYWNGAPITDIFDEMAYVPIIHPLKSTEKDQH